MKHAVVARVTEQEYLEGEKLAAARHEYVAGEVFAMAGGTKVHATISINVATALRAHLRGKPCRAYVADMKVQVEAASAFYYPDVVATCAPRDIAIDAPAHYLRAPCLIVEVLSDSTERIDRREKLLAYQQLESLVEYLIIDQDKREVEVHRRVGTTWERDIYGPGETIALASVGLDLPMDQIYEDSGIL